MLFMDSKTSLLHKQAILRGGVIRHVLGVGSVRINAEVGRAKRTGGEC